MLFRIESHIFASEEYECKWRKKSPWIETMRFSEYVMQFLELYVFYGKLAKFVFNQAFLYLFN